MSTSTYLPAEVESYALPERRAERIRLDVVLAYVLPAVVLVLVFALLDMPIIRSDGLAYYAWLHAIAHNHTYTLDAEYNLFQSVGGPYQLFYVPETGHIGNMFAFGSALLWLPSYVVVLAVGQTPWYASHIAPLINDAAYVDLHGVGFLPGMAVTLSTNLLMLVTAYLAFDIARRRTTPLLASLATIAVFAGTPLICYSSIEPTMSHVPGAFAVTLACWLWFGRVGKQRTQPRGERLEMSLLLGLVVGLAATVRWQLLLVGVPFGLLLLHQRRWRCALALALGTLLVAWTIPWVWNYMFGRALVVPAARDEPWKFLVLPVSLPNVWLSPRRGLFTWSPLVLMSLVGALLWWRRDSRTVFVIFANLLLQSLVAASVYDWWGGWGFGMRRLADLFPLYVLGLALLAEYLRRLPTNRPRWRTGLSWGAASATALVVIWSVLLLVTYTSARVNPDTGTVGDAVAYYVRAAQHPSQVLEHTSSHLKTWLDFRSAPVHPE